jgi:hypothetical protein
MLEPSSQGTGREVNFFFGNIRQFFGTRNILFQNEMFSAKVALEMLH